jgi:glycosidase
MIFILLILSLLSFTSIDNSFIKHKSEDKYIFNLDSNTVRVILRSRANDLKKVSLHYLDDGIEKSMVMKSLGSTRMKEYFYADLSASNEVLRYYFKLFKSNNTTIYKDSNSDDYFIFDRSKSQIEHNSSIKNFYYVFVDRFRNPNSDSESYMNKDKLSSFSNINDFDKFYNGDLKGIIEKIDYINDLGITALILSPIFHSKSNHKQDVIDHNSISSDFGSIDDLKNLISILNEKGIDLFLEYPLTIDKDNFIDKTLISNKINDLPKTMGYLDMENPKTIEYIKNSVNNFCSIGVKGICFNNIDKHFINNVFDGIDFKSINIPFSKAINRKNEIDYEFNFRIFDDLIKLFRSNTNDAESFLTTLKLNRLRYPNNSVAVLSTPDIERAYSSFINMDQNSSFIENNASYRSIRPDLYDPKAIDYLKISITILATYFDSLAIAYGDEIGLWGAAGYDSKKPMLWPDVDSIKEKDNINKYDKSKLKNVEIDAANDSVLFSSVINEDIKKVFTKILNFRKNKLDLFAERVEDIIIDYRLRQDILVYTRKSKKDQLIVIINLDSKEDHKLNIRTNFKGSYVDLIDEKVYHSNGAINSLEVKPLEVKMILYQGDKNE